MMRINHLSATGALAIAGAFGFAHALVAANPEEWSLHGQSTVIEQWHDGFHAPFSGTNSLRPDREDKHTATLTLFLGRRLWTSGELYYDPEITQGTGLSETVGVAGFPNGEATRAGSTTPEYNTARLFLRQTFKFSGDTETIPADKNQLAGLQAVNRLTLTFGKFAASDIFDNNVYTHDPRTQFLNWALMDNGAWDYPADVKGYTGGFAAEWTRINRTLRWGLFMEPELANGRELDPHLRRALAHAAEWEERYTISGRAGAIRTLVFWNRAHMGSYAGALRAGEATRPDVTLGRAYRSKAGAGLSWEQEITEVMGVFARAGFNDGRNETWAFTEIDRTVSAGWSVKGTCWGRTSDTVGFAGVVNGLSPDHRRYLAAGGAGFIVGDGSLHYDAERVLETFYRWHSGKLLAVTADIQFVANPAYNRARGPVAVFAVRTHVEF